MLKTSSIQNGLTRTDGMKRRKETCGLISRKTSWQINMLDHGVISHRNCWKPVRAFWKNLYQNIGKNPALQGNRVYFRIYRSSPPQFNQPEKLYAGLFITRSLLHCSSFAPTWHQPPCRGIRPVSFCKAAPALQLQAAQLRSLRCLLSVLDRVSLQDVKLRPRKITSCILKWVT